ncbi:MAG TPA: hypothetical protein VMX13_10495 [Sedimentisphaerales bacterium]|nr:hypothetical protein [Sedimentisphaerales bacterium]
MKAGAYFIVIQVCAALLCAGASAEVVVPHSEQPALIGAPNPMLAGIENVDVIIEAPDAEPNKDGLIWQALEANVRQKLSEARLLPKHSARAQPGINPSLRIDVDMLKLPESKLYVFRAQTCLAAKMQLTRDSPHFVQADIWKVQPAMEAVPIMEMADTVTRVVLEQVDAFIHCHSVANPKEVGPADANVADAPPKAIPMPAPQPDAIKYKYICSRKSNVFHKSDCRWAQRIAPNNLVGYNSREEALRTGKRPCKRCKP